MQEQQLVNAFLQTPGYICWKDRNSIFTGGNLNFLRICGLSSLSELIGKTDYDLPWGKTHAELYIADDKIVLQGKPKLNYVETQLQANKKLVKVIVNKVPLYDSEQNIIGLICHYYDLHVTPIPNKSIQLTKIQTSCLQHIVMGLSAKQIAFKMELSTRTVEHYTEILKNKLHCINKAELIKKAILLDLAPGC